MLQYIVRNILNSITVAETLTIPSYISYEAFLSFIGDQSTDTRLGAMISSDVCALRVDNTAPTLQSCNYFDQLLLSQIKKRDIFILRFFV